MRILRKKINDQKAEWQEADSCFLFDMNDEFDIEDLCGRLIWTIEAPKEEQEDENNIEMEPVEEIVMVYDQAEPEDDSRYHTTLWRGSPDELEIHGDVYFVSVNPSSMKEFHGGELIPISEEAKKVIDRFIALRFSE